VPEHFERIRLGGQEAGLAFDLEGRDCHRTYAVEGNFEQEPYGPQLGKSYSTA
jgi:hypothetical protein